MKIDTLLWLEFKGIEAWIENNKIFDNLNLKISYGDNVAILAAFPVNV